MNQYIIPVCNIEKSKVYNLTINANSIYDCQDRIMNKFSEYSDSEKYSQFVKDLDNKDILIGEIKCIDELI